MSTRLIWVLSAALIGLPMAAEASMKLYRFKVDGHVVVKDNVPPDLAPLGYEVLNSRGMVERVVPRAPTAEERAATERAEALRLDRERRHAELRNKDADLKRLYAQPGDVDRAQTRKADEIGSYIELQFRRISDLEEKLAKAQEKAANVERRGQEVPADMRLEIVQLENGIRDAQKNIDMRRKELDDSKIQFQKQRERLRILQVYELGTLPEDVDPAKLPPLQP